MFGPHYLGQPYFGFGFAQAPPVRVDGIYLELMLAGATHWTDVTKPDTMGGAGLHFHRGLPDGKPATYVAAVGELTGALKNSEYNSALTRSFYSPNHANRRPGFRQNIAARAIYILDGVLYPLFTGRLTFIDPMPGIYSERTTTFIASDFIDDLMKESVDGLPTQTNVTADALLRTVIAAMASQPVAMDFDVGVRTFPYGLIGGPGGKINPMQEGQRCCASEQGMLYVKGDGTLKFENQHARLSPVSAFTVDDAIIGKTNTAGAAPLSVISDEEDVINVVLATTHNRKVDGGVGTEVILSSLTGSPQLIPASATITINGTYRDPANPTSVQTQQVAGLSMLAFTATTDYLANSLADGTGTDYTANLAMGPVSEGGTGFSVEVTNNGPDAYLTKANRRGIGLYDYGPVTTTVTDPVSQADYKTHVLAIDLIYEPNPAEGQAVAVAIISAWANPFGLAQSVTFQANLSHARLLAACSLDIGDCVTVREEQTGIGSDFIINGVAWDVSANGLWIACTWILAPLVARAIGVVSDPVNVDWLAVGGGASSSISNVAPGGGGQVLSGTDVIMPGIFPVVVGDGGDADVDPTYGGENGEASSFNLHIAAGGQISHTVTSGASGSGRAGGTGVQDGTTPFAFAIGGGAGDAAVGANATDSTHAGNGGAGTASSISGASVTYGGGGGGGQGRGIAPFPGTGTAGTGADGGGNGSKTGAGQDGAANRGGGAGGGILGSALAKGGSGVVIIRYLIGAMTASGGTITTDGTYTIHTFTANGTFTRTS